jgi:hypothetical protein
MDAKPMTLLCSVKPCGAMVDRAKVRRARASCGANARAVVTHNFLRGCTYVIPTLHRVELDLFVERLREGDNAAEKSDRDRAGTERPVAS